MPDRVRAKFKVVVLNKWSLNGGNVVMAPVYSTDPKHENKKFWDATPSGEIRMGINNPVAFERFKMGAEYYVDFTEA